jgi:hypothetical protein
MKTVKNLVFALLLLSSFAINASAGEQDTPGYVPPPPRQMTTSDEGTVIVSSTTEQTVDVTAETSDYLLLETLAALLSVY